MRTVTAADGARLPVVGQGTWTMGEDRARRKDEVRALQLGFDLGMTLVDTAEMYASGGAEGVVGEAIRGRRHEVFVVSKVLPQNASRRGTVRAAEQSLKRLGLDTLDLYLLHWPGSHPLTDTLDAFAELRRAGKIKRYGVSNFDTAAMKQVRRLPGGQRVGVNQVVYNLKRREAEGKLLPWCVEHEVVFMGYSPLDQGGLPGDGPGRRALNTVAARHGVGWSTVAVAWSIRHQGTITIPKSSRPDHVRANAHAAGLTLTAEDLAELDAAFAPADPDAPLDSL